MFAWLKNKFKQKSAYEKIVEDIEKDNRCPCCEQNGAWLAGPRGGMSQNIMCRFCGTRLNTTDIFGSLKLDWTHGPQEDIWGGKKATKTPHKDAVTLVEISIEQGGI